MSKRLLRKLWAAAKSTNYRLLSAKLKECKDNEVNINIQDEQGNTALTFAVGTGKYIKNVELLLQHGANIHHITRSQSSALIWAALYGLSDIAALLVEYGADLTHVSASGFSALGWAARQGHQHTVSVLLPYYQHNVLHSDEAALSQLHAFYVAYGMDKSFVKFWQQSSAHDLRLAYLTGFSDAFKYLRLQANNAMTQLKNQFDRESFDVCYQFATLSINNVPEADMPSQGFFSKLSTSQSMLHKLVRKFPSELKDAINSDSLLDGEAVLRDLLLDDIPLAVSISMDM